MTIKLFSHFWPLSYPAPLSKGNLCKLGFWYPSKFKAYVKLEISPKQQAQVNSGQNLPILITLRWIHMRWSTKLYFKCVCIFSRQLYFCSPSQYLLGTLFLLREFNTMLVQWTTNKNMILSLKLIFMLCRQSRKIYISQDNHSLMSSLISWILPKIELCGSSPSTYHHPIKPALFLNSLTFGSRYRHSGGR